MKGNIIKLSAIFLIVPVAFLLPSATAEQEILHEKDWSLGPFVKLDNANPCLLPNSPSTFKCPERNERVHWEKKDVFNPAAIVKDEKIYLLYRAEDILGKHGGTSRIGIAESTDGLSFKRHPQPVLYPDPNNDLYPDPEHEFYKYEWDGGCEDPRVVENEGGTYFMTYTAFRYIKDKHPNNKARLCLATSNDLFKWKKHGPVFGENFEGALGCGNSKAGSIVCKRKGNRLIATKINGKYWMYWGDTKIFVADSNDLINWEPVKNENGEFTAVLSTRDKNFFDNELVEPGPPAVLTQDGILLIYNSKNKAIKNDPNLPPGTYAAGQVLLDPNDPTRQLSPVKRTKSYFFHPEKDYEITGQVDNVCFLQGLVYFGDRWLLYYGTADSKIAVATCNLKLQLLDRARKKFGTLSNAQEKFFIKVHNGQKANFGNGNQRALKAEHIKWLCTNPQVSELVTNKGVWVKGASIEGELDLAHAEIPFPLRFEKCDFTNNINLEQTTIPALYLPDTDTSSIEAKGLKIDGDLRLNKGFRADDQINLVGARIGGDLNCSNGKFIKTGKTAHHKKNNLDEQYIALKATNAAIKGDFLLSDGFVSVGMVELKGATIGGCLDCTKSMFINKECIENEDIKEEYRKKTKGATDPNNIALEATGVKVDGNVKFSKDFKSYGVVSLYGAKIGRELDCKGGKFQNPGGAAFNGEQMEVAGSVYLGGKEGSDDSNEFFKADGQVRLMGTTIGGNLDCSNGEFISTKGKDPKALDATRIKVSGDVLLGNDDRIKFGPTFLAEGDLLFYNAKIDGRFSWRKVCSPQEQAELDLRFAKIGALSIQPEEDKWPKIVLLHGLLYDEINEELITSKTLLHWVDRNHKNKDEKQFLPQPYEQLATVLQKAGYIDKAEDVLFEKNQNQRKSISVWAFLNWRGFWYHVFGPMIGYGYRPWRALWIGPCGWPILFSISFWILTGCILFKVGKREDFGFIRKSKELENSSGFNCLFYSIDVFFPKPNLRQEKFWEMTGNLENDSHKIFGRILLWYYRIHIIVGWILTTLLVVGLTGLVHT